MMSKAQRGAENQPIGSLQRHRKPPIGITSVARYLLMLLFLMVGQVASYAATISHTDYQDTGVTKVLSQNVSYVTYMGIDNVMRVGFREGAYIDPGNLILKVNLTNHMANLNITRADIQSATLISCPWNQWPIKTFNYRLNKWIYVGEHGQDGDLPADHISESNEIMVGYEAFTTHLLLPDRTVNIIPQQSVYLYNFEVEIRHLVPSGFVTTSMLPAEVNSAGGKWSIKNMDPFRSSCASFGPIDYTFYNSGDYVSGLKVGNYRVTFSDVDGWNTPTEQDIVVDDGAVTEVAGQYTMKLGALQGFVFPPTAVSAGAQWRLDGGAWLNSAETVNDLPIGVHMVSFKPVSGWTAPVDWPVVVNENQTASVSGTYVQQFGSLKVTISPSSASTAGAQWQLDGGTWQSSDATLLNILVGTHSISFKQIGGWDAPAPATVEIALNQLTSATASYAQHVGRLAVNIFPTEAVSAGAMWNVDGGFWRPTNTVATDLPIGQHTVNFKGITGWDTPVSQVVQIARGETNSIIGTYSQQTGSIRVDIAPSQVNLAGAMWRLDGGAWQASGTVLQSIPVGGHTVSFKPTTGWNTPNNLTIQVTSNATSTATGAYSQQTGSLTFTLSPAAAVTAGAQWRVDGGAWQNSGARISGLTVGDHPVSFKEIQGWTTPGGQMLTISNGLTASGTAEYVQLTGGITVSINPLEAVSVGAQWQVDGGAWQSNGAIVSGLSVGAHTVAFKAVQGWNAPSSQTVTVSAGATATLNVNYLQRTGSIMVELSPSTAVNAGARWQVDSGPWQDNVALLSGLSVGSHTVSFKEVPGWDTPPSRNMDVTADSVSSALVFYVKQEGSLSVVIEPQEAAIAGGQWQVDGGAWNNSGATVVGLLPGIHTVAFKALSGWTSPVSQEVEIIKNTTTSVSGTYLGQVGSIRVSLSPSQAVSAGAEWSLDGGGWQNVTILDNVDPGDHLIAFKGVSGWTEPAPQQIVVQNGLTTDVEGIYTPKNTSTKNSGGGGGGGGGCFLTSLDR